MNYDKTSAISIFDYSKLLLDHCLRDYAPENTEEYSGKGGLGQLVEKVFFEYEPNNDDGPDFAEAGLELKCTPLKYSVKQELLIKERLVGGMINYYEDYGKSFEQSHFYKKCLLMLILFYLHQANTSRFDLKFLYALLWKLPEKDLIIIRNDYEIIMKKINSGMAHTLSEGDTMYLGACRKGQKGDSLERQRNTSIGAPRRAWSLKTSYMRTLLDFIQSKEQKACTNLEIMTIPKEEVTSLDMLRHHTFDEIVIGRFEPFYNMNCNSVFEQFGIRMTRAKNKYAIMANVIASNNTLTNVNLSEEFLKAGLMMKTIRIEKNGRIKESMSFENIDYQEVYDCDEWTDSRLYEIFSNRFLFVIFKATDGKIKIPSKKGSDKEFDLEDEYVLQKAFFWTMPQEDLVIAEEYWKDIREQVLNDNIHDGAFWKIENHRNFHVRPKAQKGFDRDISPVTGLRTADKFCYWFNKEYVEKIIRDNE
ncbi:MAG: hypothetical protein IKH26_12985 [Bacteroidaceae bacterium]|nr:hypothetical protein [Bacteroidaceae bacterium]